MEASGSSQPLRSTWWDGLLSSPVGPVTGSGRPGRVEAAGAALKPASLQAGVGSGVEGARAPLQQRPVTRRCLRSPAGSSQNPGPLITSFTSQPCSQCHASTLRRQGRGGERPCLAPTHRHVQAHPARSPGPSLLCRNSGRPGTASLPGTPRCAHVPA